MSAPRREEKLSARAIEELEVRLRVLQQHLSPADDAAAAADPEPLSAADRLRNLNAALDQLASKSRAASDLLYFYHEHSDLLAPAHPTSAFGSPSPAEKLAIVNACATSFPATVSQLDSAQTLAVPPSDELAALSELHPRLGRAELQQSAAAGEVAQLRARSAAVLARWHQVGVLAQGSCWAEWEERLVRVEGAVRSRERVREEERA